jgi:predicted dehydrogenase
MISIGVVNIDTSHPLGFTGYLETGQRARYDAVYNDGFRGDDEVEAFITNHGLKKRYSSIDEMADNVDVGFIQSVNWDDHLRQAMPFINRGKPVFLDKPIVGNIRDCRKVEELAKAGAVILGSSSARYCQEIAAFNALPEEEKGKVVSVFATVGVDEFNYGCHVAEVIGGLLGPGAASNTFVGRAEMEGKTCGTFFVRFDSGITATYHSFLGTWQPFEVVVMTTKTAYQFRIDTTKVYGALLDRICDFLESGKRTLAPVEELTESVKIMLAGRISRESGSTEVRLSDIPENDPGFDGQAFAQGYAAASPKMYLSA